MDGDRAAEACPKFEESNRLEPSAGTLLNLGKCYETLKRTATAWATYKKAISLGKSTGETRQVGAAEEYLAAIEPRLARLTVKVAAQTPGLTIERIDSHGIHTVIAEASRGVPVNVDPDRYQVKASAPGFTTYTTGVELDTDAEAKSVEIPELVKIEHHDTAPIPVKSSGPDRLLVTGVVLASVGVISAAVGIGFGVTTLSDSNTALSDKSLCPNHACTAKGLSLIERAKTESTASTVSLSLGAALAVVGTTMFTWSVVHAKSESDRGDAQKPSAGSDITFVPSAVVLPNGQFAACFAVRGTL